MEWVDRLEGASSSNAAWSDFMTYAGHFGFECGAMADLPAPHENLRATTLSWSWPEQWRERYLEKDYVSVDPTVSALQFTSNPYSWKEALGFQEYGKAERRVFDEASQFGMCDGLVIPITGIRTGTALITITGPATEIPKIQRRALFIVAVTAHQRIRDFVTGPVSTNVVTLTPRERECVSWAAAGKTDADIADILSISVHTATAHLKNAARKYRVNTRGQVIVHALRNGAIFL